MKKILLTLIIGMFLISLVSAGADCSIPTIKQGDIIELTQTCDDNCTEVNLTKVMFPNQSISLLGQFPMTANGTNYNFTFSNTNALGTYFYSVTGISNSFPLSQSCSFKVTQTGFLLETSESLLYIIILIATFILFLGFLYPAISLPYSNKINKDGSITRINKAKYLKLLSIWFSYGFFMWFLQTLNAISVSYITLTYLSNFITNIFTYIQGFSVGITFLILIIIFVEIWKDIILSKTIKRYGKVFLDGRLK